MAHNNCINTKSLNEKKWIVIFFLEKNLYDNKRIIKYYIDKILIKKESLYNL